MKYTHARRPLQTFIYCTLLAIFAVPTDFNRTAHSQNVRVANTPNVSVPRYDLLITNGTLVDGTGKPAYRADIAITQNRIARIDKRIDPREARKVIDAQGLTVAPGFVDVHTHAEGVFNQPEAENFVRMGVTTIVTGNCGSSALDIGKFLDTIKLHPTTVNVATLIAHGTIRAQVMGNAEREPNAQELQRMETFVERGMKDGALGLSTGLIYLPGAYAKTDEIVSLARVAARYKGIYATHMRNEGDGVFDSLNEAISIGEQAQIPVEVSHLKILSPKLWGQTDRALKLLADARKRGVRVTADQYLYTASSTSLDTLVPYWLRGNGMEQGTVQLEDKATRERAVNEMLDSLRKKGLKDYSYAVIASYPANTKYNGRSIADIANGSTANSNAANSGSEDALRKQADLILEMYEAGGASMVFHSISEQDVQTIVRDPFVMFGSDSAVRRFGEGVPHPRGYGNAARLLGRYVRELKLVALEDAVRRMTQLPVQTFKLGARGELREGFAADIVIFDARTISDRATFDKPHQYPVGINRVIVGGQEIFADGKLTGARPGVAVRGTGTD